VAVVEAEVREDQGVKMQEKETLDEKLPGLFEPDTLLPIQYFEAMRKKHLLEGEKRLILSVLEDAIECFMKCIDATSSKSQRLFRDAEEWIGLEDKHWVFSFDNVCEMLDINPEYLRRGLKEWKERKIAALERAREARLQAEANPIAINAPVPVVEPIRGTDTAHPVVRTKPIAAPAPKVFASARSRRKTVPVRPRAAHNLRKARA
jgi:hypothetical protein